MSKDSSKLTEMQELFCREYIIDLNATHAAIRAGYSKATAGSMGHKLINNPTIQDRLQELMAERQERLNKRIKGLEITADRVLEEQARIAFYNILDLFHPDGLMKDVTEITKDQAAALHSIKMGAIQLKNEDGSERPHIFIRSIKMQFKDKALDALAKHLGLYEADNKQKGDAELKTRQEFMKELFQQINGATRGLPKPRLRLMENKED